MRKLALGRGITGTPAEPFSWRLMWYFRAIAVDLDGTLASNDAVHPSALQAIETTRRERRMVLVTGRTMEDLRTGFPGLTARFDAVVTENGGVLHTRTSTRQLAEPVDPAVDKALADRGVVARRGRVLVAVDGGDVGTVVQVLTALGLDCQVVHNRAAAMILPAGVTKGSGLTYALDELGLSAHNTIAVGDAENDFALLQAAEVGVAVANAVPSLAEHADLVLDQADGEGIATLLAGPLLAGHQRLCPPRQWVQVGEFEDGQATCVPGSQTSVLISGDTGAGKSYLAGLLAERWIEAGYSVLVVDREGDHLGLATRPGVHLVDAAEHLPTPSDLLAIARPNRASIVLDLSGRSTDTKLDYVRRLPAAISAERALHGIPHWVVHDEAHEELWAADTQTAKLAVAEPGLCLVTWQPDSLPDEVRRSLAVMLTVTEATPRPAPLRATAQFAGEQARPFRIGERLSTHVRHQHKYATTPLPHHRRFYFHDTDGGMPAVASLDEFRQHLRHCDLDTLDYHLTRGDFSRWVIGTLADHDLGADLAAIEHDLTMHRASELERARRRTIDSIERRYLTPPDR